MSLQAKLLSTLLLIFTALTSSTIYFNYQDEKAFVESLIKGQTEHTVDQYFDSVNTLMITGAMDNREVLRKKLLSRDEITDARVIRGKAVVADYGEGYDHEKPKDDYDLRALQGEKFVFISNTEKGRVLTVIHPYKASKDYRGTNCIECHAVKEGTVLGAVRVSYSLESLDQRIVAAIKESGTHMGILSVIALILMAIILHFMIIRKIKKANNTMNIMADNYDLTQRLPNGGSDEIGNMAKSFNHMVEELHRGMKSVSASTEKIIKGGQDISELTVQTTEDIISQQEETNKVASAMTEMSTTAKQVSDNSANAKVATSTASSEVSTGVSNGKYASEKITSLTQYIGDISGTIHNLESEAKKITEAIEVIYDITMKTQHLSINAAVEAARAGVHGRGFVVVAEEIGELAHQTKTTTNKIQEVTANLNDVVFDAVEKMKETNELAKEGNEQVSQSTNSLHRISQEVETVVKMNEYIATAAQEQSFASEEIDRNIQLIMDLSIKNSNSAKEMGQLGRDFEDMAHELEAEVLKFKL
jgi:methyl-accepting chemotaxis protein